MKWLGVLMTASFVVLATSQNNTQSTSANSTDDNPEARSTPRYFNKTFVFPPDQPVVYLNATTAFNKLTVKEQNYAHYMSRASYFGSLIVLLQLSQESPQIFRLLHRINLAQSPEELRNVYKGSEDISDEDLDAFFIYCSGIYTNMGNYKSFGDTKFIPDLPVEKFEQIVKGSKAWSDDTETMSKIWGSVRDVIWSVNDYEKQLGLGDKGVTKYFSSNCNQDDADKVSSYLKKKGLEAWMTRVIKTVDPKDNKPIYEIRSAAVNQSVEIEREDFEDAHFTVTAGDYSELLNLVNVELEKSKNFVANDFQFQMLDNYIDSFQTGNLDSHKNGSRFWIQDKSPNVESYIGFIEVYRDPVNQRSEFEGFVSMVNKDQSVKFQQLVENAEKFIPLLPWPSTFEKDKFLRPDFTSLDVLAFAGAGIPKGINIPNYDEIRQTEGFKNVNLGNVVSSAQKDKKKTNFVSQEDHELLDKYKILAFDVQVGLHELLGHGSGKLFNVDADGKSNFDVQNVINPLTNQTIDPKSVYQPGDTYGSKFSSISSSYEECRAETVGLYLSRNADVLKIFGFEEKENSDVTYVNWLSLGLTGISSLEFYSPTSKEWKQAHSQARFAILQVLFEAGQDFVKLSEVKGEDGEPDLLFEMDRSKLESVGAPAIRQFLLKLQVYKSTGDIESATKMYDRYTSVNEDDPAFPWLKWRDIAIARRKPRKMYAQANTVSEGGAVKLLEYEETHDGLIQSWTDRFSAETYKQIDEILANLYEKDLPHFQKESNSS